MGMGMGRAGNNNGIFDGRQPGSGPGAGPGASSSSSSGSNSGGGNSNSNGGGKASRTGSPLGSGPGPLKRILQIFGGDTTVPQDSKPVLAREARVGGGKGEGVGGEG